LGIQIHDTYIAVDKEGDTVDFLLTKRGHRISAQNFLIKAIERNIKPELINSDKSGANTAAKTIQSEKLFKYKNRAVQVLE